MTAAISSRLRTALDGHAEWGRTAFVVGSVKTSYAELAEMVNRHAAGLARLGLGNKALIGIISAKTPEAVAAFLGGMQAGACMCFIEPRLVAKEVGARTAEFGIACLLHDDANAERLAPLAAQGQRLVPLASLPAEPPAGLSWRQAEEAAMLQFTSGSTGWAKAVLLSQGNLDCNATGVLARTGVTHQDRLLHVMPLHHTNGVNNQIIVPLLSGATILLEDRFSAETAVDQLRSRAITYMTGVPTMYARMLPFVTPSSGFPALRFLRCGSAPITEVLHRQIEEAFGVPLVVSYGLSEATCTTTMNPPDARRIGSVGTVLEGQRVSLRFPGSEREVPESQEGEICIEGPTMMQGYLGPDGCTPPCPPVLRTGDIGRFDSDGYLSITGRIKELIIRGGENISPKMIEETIATHPAVAECCVVSGPHRDLGEVPVAAVVLVKGRCATAGEIRGHVAQSLAQLYVPDSVHFLKSLPLNSTGKIDRRSLAEQLSRAQAPD